MGFLDKAKEKAGKLVDATKDKVDDLKDKRKAGDLLDDLGRILYRQRTGRGTPDDEAAIAKLVADLQALEAEGTEGIVEKLAEAEPSPSPEAAAPPAPAPMPEPSTGSAPPPPPPTPQA